MKDDDVLLHSLYAGVVCDLTCAGETSKVEEMTFDLTPAGRVTVVADEGTIRVRSWDKDQVHLKITSRVWTSERERAEELLEKLEVLSQGRCSVHTDEGDVFLSISDQSSVSLTIETENGRIRSEVPFDIHHWSEDGERMEGVVGDGLARLSASMTEGNITLQTD